MFHLNENLNSAENVSCSLLIFILYLMCREFSVVTFPDVGVEEIWFLLVGESLAAMEKWGSFFPDS